MKRTRRRFLEATGGALGAAVVGKVAAAGASETQATAPSPATRQAYDVAVIGAGVFGSWTAWHLQKAGRKVALVDAYGPASSRASSGGESRVTRIMPRA